MAAIKPVMTLIEFAAIFEPKLQTWVKEKTHTYNQYTQDGHILEWLKYIEKLTASGGKRIRPYLMYLTAQQQTDTVWRCAIALELFHLFCLIHDDIIDEANARRGVTTVHRYIAQRLQAEERICNVDHIGYSQALLLGDLVLSWVFELMNGTDIPASARRTFQAMVDEVVIGQMIDVEIMTRSQVSESFILEKMYLKTASYTFIRPMLIGAELADANAATKSSFQEFGKSLGLAFQVQDDLLDLMTPSTTSGKSVFTDLRDRQHTFFTQHILDKGNLEQKEALCALWGKPLTEEDRPAIEKLFTDTGAFESGQAKMNQFFNEAETVLANTEFASELKDQLQQLSAYLRNRHS